MFTKVIPLSFSALLALVTFSTNATIYDVTIDGSDAIWLAGRTDLTIPPASDPWPGGMIRHGGPTPEEILETIPPEILVSGGDVVKVADPAVGGISFFNGFGAPYYGPEGNPGVSTLNAFGGISGYKGTEGALAGVFLDNAIPNGTPPSTLDFTGAGLGTDFLTLFPEIGQIFFIGDGITSTNVFQQFIAPAGATRLFLGIPDGFGFDGNPGAYDDNDGSYRIKVGINQTPLPEPNILALIGLGMLGFIFVRRKTSV